MNLKSPEERFSNFIAFVFTCVILINAASGPLSEFTRWVVEVTTPDFEDLSRGDKRLLLREH